LAAFARPTTCALKQLINHIDIGHGNHERKASLPGGSNFRLSKEC
jgi:hypothetical protein